MHMYRTGNVGTPEYFIDELSQFMSEIISTIE